MNIEECIEILMKDDGDFITARPTGIPKVNFRHQLPEDVMLFYRYFGGVSFFNKKNAFPIRILSAEEFILANPKLVGEIVSEDISSTWYLLADACDGNYISIDLEVSRLGRCYESFEYTHGIMGNCPIIALSFTEFLSQILSYEGNYFYWKENSFPQIGDAYSTIQP